MYINYTSIKKSIFFKKEKYKLEKKNTYPIFLVLDKEENSVYFQHNFLVPGCYDMLCHPNFFPINKCFICLMNG